jgi:diadenosine tetraphosphate (Ap4A) HIT family hydrolase
MRSRLPVRKTAQVPWWPADQWARMTRGDACEMCADAHLTVNPASDLVAESQWSYVRLHRNQTKAGYSVVIANRHEPELHDLSEGELCGFWSDVAAVGRAISEMFRPVKLANLSMGFRTPHVHCHVYPQYEDDDPYRLIDVTDGDVRLNEVEWAERVATMRRLLQRER